MQELDQKFGYFAIVCIVEGKTNEFRKNPYQNVAEKT
jgi:hypothetical protein